MLGAAGFFFWQAATARFRDELDLRDANAAEREWVVPLGRAGHAALGAVDVTVGIFLIIAAVRRNAGEAKGLGDALAVLAQRPYGGALLGAVALGLVATRRTPSPRRAIAAWCASHPAPPDRRILLLV